MNEDQTMAYAATFPGMPGYGAVCVDRSEYNKETAKTVAEWMRRGGVITRVTLDEARRGMGEYLEAKKAKKAEKGEQGSLI